MNIITLEKLLTPWLHCNNNKVRNTTYTIRILLVLYTNVFFINGSLMHTKLKYGYKLGSIFPGYNYLHCFCKPLEVQCPIVNHNFFPALIAIYSIARLHAKHLVGPLCIRLHVGHVHIWDM